MTFFANAGISWPNVEAQLREAGTQALDAGANFWAFISEMERWSADEVGDFEGAENLRNTCIKKLYEASDIYSNNLNSIGDIQVRALDPFEYNLVDGFFRGSNGYFTLEDPYDVRTLYETLILLIRDLARQLAILDVKRRKDITPLVFRSMQQWELITAHARLIAVLNSRPNARTIERR
jgi:hypothetical protein